MKKHIIIGLLITAQLTTRAMIPDPNADEFARADYLRSQAEYLQSAKRRLNQCIQRAKTAEAKEKCRKANPLPR